MTDEDEAVENDSDSGMTISVEYTPMESLAMLQILDYLDVLLLREGIPLRAISIQRRKILGELLKEDVLAEMQDEQEEMAEHFEEMFESDPTDDFFDELGRGGFQ